MTKMRIPVAISFNVVVALLAAAQSASIVSIVPTIPVTAYEQYETCLFQLRPEEWNHTSSIYQQAPCLGLINTTHHVNHKDMFDLHYEHKYNISSSDHLLPNVCRLGRSAYHLNHKTMPTESFLVPVSGINCTSRSFNERISHHEAVHTLDSKSALGLFESFHSQGITTFISIGDSVSEQLFTFLVCDSIRDGIVSTTHIRDDIEYNDNMHIRFELISKQAKFDLIKYKAGWPGGDSLIVDAMNASDVYYGKMINILETTLNNAHLLSRAPLEKSRTVIVINFAFHVMRPFRYESIPTLCKAILDFAKSHSDVFIMFRPATAQHFTTSQSGEYAGRNTGRVRNDTNMCCDKFVANEGFSSKMNAHFQAEFAAIDSSWMQVIGWADIFDITASLYNYHVEYGERAKSVDCSHYVYFPHMMNPIWLAYAKEVSRLVHLRQQGK